MIKKFTQFIFAIAFSATVFAGEPITIVVPTPPGGAIDMTARSLSKALMNKGHDNVVVYHPGANGDIALNIAVEKRDNVIFVASSANFVFSNVLLNRENVYTTKTQLIGPSVTNPMVFITPETGEVKTFRELIDSAKKKETVCGVSNSHGEIELKQINLSYGTKFVPVPYKGTGQMIPDIVGGHTPCGYDQIAAYTGLESKVKFLASSKVVRSDIPAMSTVLPKYQFETWYATAIPNNSNLLKNAELINIVKTWNQDAELTKPLTEKSFIVVKTDVDLNARAVKETEYYRDQLKK